MTTNVFELPRSSHPPPKISAHLDTFPTTYLDPQHPPKTKPPWKALHDLQLIKTVSLTIPKTLHNHLEFERFFNLAPKPQGTSHNPLTTRSAPAPSSRQRSYPQFESTKYCKFIAPLSALLAHTNLRRGSYVFLSEGNPSSNDTVITLIQGTLRISMSRQVFQRSGLPFNAWRIPGAAGGRKHDASSARWRLELDLRAPSMLKGRKGFDRLLWAAERVEGLKEPQTWLFCRADPGGGGTGPDAQTDWVPEELIPLHPTLVNERVRVATVENVILPPFLGGGGSAKGSLPEILGAPVKGGVRTDEDIYEVVEYFNLIEIGSPRVLRGKRSFQDVDPYLCSYRLPLVGSDDATFEEMGDIAEVTTLKWRGIISAEWTVQLLMQILKQARRKIDARGRRDGWCMLSVTGHRTEAVGRTDGVSLLLQTGCEEADDDVNVTMEDPAPEAIDLDKDIQDGITDESGKPRQQEHSGGFRYFSCFQFIDS